MSKETVFVEYMTMLSEIWPHDIKSNSTFKGNLSVFIDIFYSTDEWNSIDKQLKDYIENKDVNEISFFLAERLYNYVVNEADRSKAQNDISRCLFALAKDFYSTGDLDSFSFCPPSLFS